MTSFALFCLHALVITAISVSNRAATGRLLISPRGNGVLKQQIRRATAHPPVFAHQWRDLSPWSYQEIKEKMGIRTPTPEEILYERRKWVDPIQPMYILDNNHRSRELKDGSRWYSKEKVWIPITTECWKIELYESESESDGKVHEEWFYISSKKPNIGAKVTQTRYQLTDDINTIQIIPATVKDLGKYPKTLVKDGTRNIVIDPYAEIIQISSERPIRSATLN